MSTQPLRKGPLPEMPQVRQSLGTIVLGAILMLFGLAWILDVLNVVSLSLGMILPSALILIGVALLAGSLSGSHGGLIALGIVLTVLLSGAAATDIPLSGGTGDHSYRPVSVTELQDRYHVAAGSLTLDLRQLDLPAGETSIDARVGVGQMSIHIPSDTAFKIHWVVSGGNVNIETRSHDGNAIGNRSQDGASLDDTYVSPGYDNAVTKVNIDVRMGFGNIDVRQP